MKNLLTKNNIMTLILGGIIILLLVGTCNRSKKIEKLEDENTEQKRIIQLKQDSINYYDGQLSLVKTQIVEKDKIIKEKELELKNIPIKYVEIKQKIKTLSPIESTQYLSDRLSLLNPQYKSKYPLLTKNETDLVTLIDTTQLKLVNGVFVELDENKELLCQTESLLSTVSEKVTLLETSVDNQGKQIDLYKDIVLRKDTIIGNNEKIIEKQGKQIKRKNTVIKVLAITSAVFGLLSFR